jgi:AAA ATPase domain
MLAGRGTECARLDELLAEAHVGRSAVLLLRGEAGIGKSALLEHAAARAEDYRVLRAIGAEWEMELPFAGLHQLCVELLDGRDRLPAPQRDALATAFGLSSGAQPDRFLVGLGVLSLLSDAAEENPLVCVVDDVQWLDRSSAQCSRSWPGAWRRSRLFCFSRSASRTDSRSWPDFPSCAWGDCRTRPRGICSDPSSPLLWTSAFGSGFSLRRAAILSRCLNCPRVASSCTGGWIWAPQDGSLPDRVEANFPAACAAAARRDATPDAVGGRRPDG